MPSHAGRQDLRGSGRPRLQPLGSGSCARAAQTRPGPAQGGAPPTRPPSARFVPRLQSAGWLPSPSPPQLVTGRVVVPKPPGTCDGGSRQPSPWPDAAGPQERGRTSRLGRSSRPDSRPAVSPQGASAAVGPKGGVPMEGAGPTEDSLVCDPGPSLVAVRSPCCACVLVSEPQGPEAIIRPTLVLPVQHFRFSEGLGWGLLGVFSLLPPNPTPQLASHRFYSPSCTSCSFSGRQLMCKYRSSNRNLVG